MKSIAIAFLLSAMGASASASTCNQGVDVSQMSLAELREDKAEKLSAPPKYTFLLSSNGKRVRSADGTPILSPAYPGIECEVSDSENHFAKSQAWAPGFNSKGEIDPGNPGSRGFM